MTIPNHTQRVEDPWKVLSDAFDHAANEGLLGMATFTVSRAMASSLLEEPLPKTGIIGPEFSRDEFEKLCGTDRDEAIAFLGRHLRIVNPNKRPVILRHDPEQLEPVIWENPDEDDDQENLALT